MHLQRASSGRQLNFSRSAALTCGGEGCIYPVLNDFSLLAKVYHKPDQERAHKLACMVAHPLDDPMAAQGHVSVAWPIDLLLDTGRHGQVVGFLMHRVNDLIPIVNFYNPSGRRQSCPLFNWYYLHQTARNLAAAFAAIHKRGDLVADVNSRNILASQRALVTLVDTDSFQVCDPNDGHVFRCPVGTAEYTPPELQNCDLGTVDRKVQHDCFGLAIILFQLLMEGTHPFAGAFLGGGDPPPYEERIQCGHFPYSEKNGVPYRPMPIAPPLNILSPLLQHLFLRCFEEGHRDPAARPDAQTWQNALEEAENALVSCTFNMQHRYSGHLASCPWCERSKLLGGRDPFPSTQVVQKGQHLQPLKRKPQPQPRRRTQNYSHTQVVFSPGSHHASRKQRSVFSRQVQQQSLNLAQSLPSQAQPTPDPSLPLACAVIFFFGLSFFVADGWKYRVLYAGVVLFAGLGRMVFRKYPNLLAAVGVRYVGFTLLMVAGVLAPLIIPPIVIALLSPLVIAVWFLADHSLSFLLKYVVFALCAIPSSLIVLDWPPPRSAPVTQTPSTLSTPSKTPSIMNANPGESLRILTVGHSPNPAVAWSPDGKTIARTNSDNSVSLWNAQTGVLLQNLDPASPVYAVAWNPKSNTLATGSSDGAIKLWDATSGRLLAAMNQSNSITALGWSPNGRTLASMNWDGTITFWHGRGASRTTIHNTSLATSLAWSPDSRTIAIGDGNGSVSLWDPAGSKLRVRSESSAISITSLSWSPDGKTIASAGSDHQITLWNVSEEGSVRALRTIQGHTAMILTVAWSPNGSMLASAADDQTVRLWDPVKGTQLRTIHDPRHNVQVLAWSPDSSTLAIDNAENITLWNVHRSPLSGEKVLHAPATGN